MRRTITVIVLMAVMSMSVLSAQAWAKGIKERMRERLPVIVDLKARGIVGENNQGFLEFIKGKSEKKDVVDAENKDRRIVYKAIAAKQGTTVDLVGKRRALQIAEKAKPGEWLQNEQGQWYQK